MSAAAHTRAAAWLLAGFCLLTAVLFHCKFGERNQLLHFEKNLTMAGGFLILAIAGPGRFNASGLLPPRLAAWLGA